MEEEKASSPIKDIAIMSDTASSDITPRDIKDELLRETSGTGEPARFYIEAELNKNEKPIFTMSQKRENIQDIVGEKESERRERRRGEKWEKTKRWTYFWERMIRAVSDGVGDLLARFGILLGERIS